MRLVAQLLAAAGILAEGLVVGGLLFVLGGVVDAYSMSLNGADPGDAQVAIRVAAVVLGLALAALGAGLGRAALRHRPARRLTMAALVVQCVVVAVAGVALGWAVFLGALLVLGFLLWVQLDEQPLEAEGR
ncbi:hypothetical protein ACFFX1_47540 [Dactylosporangium sucinum]|uniref:Uncharacterized protein n=1 Tax=Dactylosporangium sucinum TaxID=1424081 RepID=A0A917TMB1_9ACTN|nr:hypothetical protein [Dactylosporangium sucinum]GGM28829.1 hypothetical protein GCM10007977_032620 [Dactylosporangium sucinum]